jgi:hypothetical protein
MVSKAAGYLSVKAYRTSPSSTRSAIMFTPFTRMDSLAASDPTDRDYV